MQVTRDPLSFLKAFIEPGLDTRGQTAYSKSIEQPEESNPRQDAQRPKPCGLIEGRENTKASGRALFVPQLIIVRSNYMALIVPRRQIAIESSATILRILPVRIASLKLIAKFHFFWHHQAECGVVNLNIPSSRRKPELLARNILDSVCNDLFHKDRRRNAVSVEMFGIDHLQDVFVRKPELAVGCSRNFWPEVSQTGLHTVEDVQGLHSQLSIGLVPPSFQFNGIDRDESALHIEPKRTLAIPHEGEYIVARKPIMRSQVFHPAFFPAEQAFLSNPPCRAICVYQQISNRKTAGTICRHRVQPSMLVAGYTPVR